MIHTMNWTLSISKENGEDLDPVLQAYNMFMEVSFGFFAASIGSCAHLGTTNF